MTGRSARRRILLSRDTLLGLIAVLVLAAVCVVLGMWQFGRYEDRRDAAEVIRTNYDASPVALDEVIDDVEAPLPASREWTPVTLRGSYCTEPSCVLYVRNRQLEGSVGFWQLVPFRTDEGTTLLVVRGWVPSDSSASQPADPAPIPEGELTATVRLRPAEVVLDREPPPGQTHSVNPGQSAGLMGLEDPEVVTGAFGELAAEEPAADRPAALSSPDTSLGPHLSYAFQWWVFALFFPGALVYRTRRQLQDLAAEEQEARADAAGHEHAPGAQDAVDAGTDDAGTADGTDSPEGTGQEPESPREGEGARRPAPRRTDRRTHHRPRRAVHTRRRGQDEEEEDALIDQQEQ